MPVIYQEVDLSVCCILHRPGCSPTTQTGKPRHREVKPFSCSNLDERRQGQASVGSRTSPSLRGGHLRKPPPACTALTVSCSPPSPSPPPLLSHDPPPQPSQGGRREINTYLLSTQMNQRGTTLPHRHPQPPRPRPRPSFRSPRLHLTVVKTASRRCWTARKGQVWGVALGHAS